MVTGNSCGWVWQIRRAEIDSGKVQVEQEQNKTEKININKKSNNKHKVQKNRFVQKIIAEEKLYILLIFSVRPLFV